MVLFFEADGNFEDYNYTVKIIEVIVFIRMLKLLTLLYEIQTMRVIFETMKNLMGPLTHVQSFGILHYNLQVGGLDLISIISQRPNSSHK